ncbi:hypothetical protein DENSPDRAFT_853176 [Dentipellis sp. KUC8613]|nr:hypothetical protein DENSPDRAFT_853176 [Dentipellis sp. KUC8613]
MSSSETTMKKKARHQAEHIRQQAGVADRVMRQGRAQERPEHKTKSSGLAGVRSEEMASGSHCRGGGGTGEDRVCTLMRNGDARVRSGYHMRCEAVECGSEAAACVREAAAREHGGGAGPREGGGSAEEEGVRTKARNGGAQAWNGSARAWNVPLLRHAEHSDTRETRAHGLGTAAGRHRTAAGRHRTAAGRRKTTAGAQNGGGGAQTGGGEAEDDGGGWKTVTAEPARRGVGVQRDETAMRRHRVAWGSRGAARSSPKRREGVHGGVWGCSTRRWRTGQRDSVGRTSSAVARAREVVTAHAGRQQLERGWQRLERVRRATGVGRGNKTETREQKNLPIATSRRSAPRTPPKCLHLGLRECGCIDKGDGDGDDEESRVMSWRIARATTTFGNSRARLVNAALTQRQAL